VGRPEARGAFTAHRVREDYFAAKNRLFHTTKRAPPAQAHFQNLRMFFPQTTQF